MGPKPLLKFDWGDLANGYCNPVRGVWETKLENGIWTFTSCLVDSVLLRIASNLVFDTARLDCEAHLLPEISAHAEEILSPVGAFAEWPGIRAAFQLCSPDGEVQTVELEVVTTRIGSSASTGGFKVPLVNGSLVVPCSKDSTLEILQLQPAAKKVTSGREFLQWVERTKTYDRC
ncbi:unnamed protein product [Calypogeia fissa]